MADGTFPDSHIKASTQVISSSTAQIPAHRRFSGLNPQQTSSSFRSKTAMASSVSSVFSLNNTSFVVEFSPQRACSAEKTDGTFADCVSFTRFIRLYCY